jgi:hypothetical protein
MVSVRKTLVYILLFFYVSAQLKPLTYVLKDVVAHTFFKMQHLASVHYEKGHYHLHTEIETLTKKEESQQPSKTNSEKKQDKTWPEIKTDFDSDLTLNILQLPTFFRSNKPLSAGYRSSCFHPPTLG